MVPHRLKPTGRRFAFAGWLLLLGLLLTIAPARGQAPTNATIYAKRSSFLIPFETDGAERQLQEVRLYVSEDQGQTWKKYHSVPPGQHGFDFRAEHDGLYWFTVQTVDVSGNQNPQNVQGAQPQLRIYVDTHAPVVTLRSRPANDGMVAVEWDIRDDNLDPVSFVLDYRLQNSADWLPLVSEPTAKGERVWNPGTTRPVEVRLRVRDLAKNESEKRLTLSPGSQEYRTAGSPADQDGARPADGTVLEKRWVNSKRISLNYEVQEKGPSGVSIVELWWTRDGREWKKYKEEAEKPPMVFDVYDEGTYGFRLVIKNGVGLGEPPPRPGDPPQIWIEVDLKKPLVHYVKTEIGQGPDTGNLTIAWESSDKNLAREPITISWAEDDKGPWTPIVSNYENTGRYVWRKGAGPPFRFKVKVEAKDKAGNIGENETIKPVLFDLAQPKGRITGVQPAGDKPESNTESDGKARSDGQG